MKAQFGDIMQATEVLRPDSRGYEAGEAALPDVAHLSWRLAAPWEMPYIAEAKLSARRKETADLLNITEGNRE